jgi:hypothetical protein
VDTVRANAPGEVGICRNEQDEAPAPGDRGQSTSGFKPPVAAEMPKDDRRATRKARRIARGVGRADGVGQKKQRGNGWSAGIVIEAPANPR